MESPWVKITGEVLVAWRCINQTPAAPSGSNPLDNSSMWSPPVWVELVLLCGAQELFQESKQPAGEFSQKDNFG